MKKPGPRPRDADAKKSVHVGLRITPQLHQRLSAEAEKSERSLSQEIETRIRESFDFDKSIQELLGGNDYHHVLLRQFAEVVVLIELQTGLNYVEDRFTFDLVKTAINTMLDHFKPPGRSSLPERLGDLKELVGEPAIKELGKRLALLSLVPIELRLKHGQNLIALPGFLDPNIASRHLSRLMRKPVIEELNEIWRREEKSVNERALARHQAALEQSGGAKKPTISAVKVRAPNPRRSGR